MTEPSAGRSAIVYDGACAFCRQAIRTIRARDRDEQFVYLPRQTPGIEEQFPQLRIGDFDTGMRLFEPDNAMYVGADAIYRITLKLPYFRRLSWMFRVPLLRPVIKFVYSWIAANRLRLSSYCMDGCRIEVQGESDSERGAGESISRHQIFISLLILCVIGLHGWANVAKTLMPSSLIGDRSWPFLAYGMYRQSHDPRTIRTTKHEVIGITVSGEQLHLGPKELGMYPYALRRRYLDQLRGGSATTARFLADRINMDREDPVTAFRVESETYIISDTGVAMEAKEAVNYPVVK
jgi:predicted DCC family thiol-disulfide oxidoreductase YuxK